MSDEKLYWVMRWAGWAAIVWHSVPNVSHVKMLLNLIESCVVYFNQRTHACACVCMVENDWKHKKMNQPAFGSHSQSLTNKLFFAFCYESLSCASLAHEEKHIFLFIFLCFQSFSTMQTHAQACVLWLKYTTQDSIKLRSIFTCGTFVTECHTMSAQPAHLITQ